MKVDSGDVVHYTEDLGYHGCPPIPKSYPAIVNDDVEDEDDVSLTVFRPSGHAVVANVQKSEADAGTVQAIGKWSFKKKQK